MPIRDCPCGCNWTKHVIINRYSVAEMDLLQGFEKKKKRAGNAVSYAIANKQLRSPERCERCNRLGRTGAHHEDYDKPLEIEWLCQVCHYYADRARREREAEQFFGVTLAAVREETIRAVDRSAA